MNQDVRTRMDAARELARLAGERTLRLFQSTGLVVDRKRDGTAVTEADRDAERFLREQLAARFPRDAVLGEEYGATEGTSGFRWVLDPIDGTASFVCGVPLYGTLVAVQREADGRPLVGVIEMPALRERVWAGTGLGAWHEGGPQSRAASPARVSSVGSMSDAVLCTTGPEYFDRAGRPELFARLAGQAGLVRGWSDCYAFLLVATGRADVCVEPAVKVWDVAAPAVVIEEAGGRWSDWSGRTLVDSGSILTTNGRLHEAALGLVR